jgi:hypothetical protein
MTKIAIDISSLLVGKDGPTTVPGALRAEGRRDKHMGPRWESAEVEVVVEPASQWEGVVVEYDEPNVAAMVANGWVEGAILGLLDELVGQTSPPIANIRIRVTRLVADPVNSSTMAFRNAGREAGRSIRSQLAGLKT